MTLTLSTALNCTPKPKPAEAVESAPAPLDERSPPHGTGGEGTDAGGPTDAGTAPTGVDAGLPTVYPEAILNQITAASNYGDLEGLRLNSLVYQLEPWLAVGESRGVWVLDDQRDCEPTELRRLPPGRYDRLPEHGVRKWPRFRLRRYQATAPEQDGHRRRVVTEELVGHVWSKDNGTTTEALIDGQWTEVLGEGVGERPANYGVLFDVTATRARWGGDEVGISVVCSKELLACAGGGLRPCPNCDQASVGLHRSSATIVYGSGWGDGGGRGGYEPCDDPCPKSVLSAELQALQSLNRYELWRWPEADAGPFAGIYLRRSECMRDVPAPGERRPTAY